MSRASRAATRRARRAVVRRRRVRERAALRVCLEHIRLDDAGRRRVEARAATLVERLRRESSPGVVQSFLAEYGLSTDEGVALMCLAEAYLRTPDADTLDALIRDKVGTGDWSRHRGGADSPFVNVTTWALMLTGRVFRDRRDSERELTDLMLDVARRLGEPVARAAVAEVMRVMGEQFVLGRTIDEALDSAASRRGRGCTHSFDMLGEAARTEADARRYFLAYSRAISSIAAHADAPAVHDNPGISVKLSALHPRFERVQRARVMRELGPRLAALAQHARAANIGLNVDAEEMNRLDVSLELIEAVLRSGGLAGWPGFGVVVQAYSKQALAVIDWLDALTAELGVPIAVRLVKGAYWDSEIKSAQVLGLDGYPVFTAKAATDVSYLACATRLLELAPRVYPQFATHNAHTACAILEIARGDAAFEFQRLHGMGEELHELLARETGRRCRIYAPVGVHKDLLAYLVRRLLENGANSSFVHQLLDREVPAARVAADPVASLTRADLPAIALPVDLYAPGRVNSRGLELNDPGDAAALERIMSPWRGGRWSAAPTVAGAVPAGPTRVLVSPADHGDVVGDLVEATPEAVAAALVALEAGRDAWRAAGVEGRARILERAAELYEEHRGELVALACREAGKTRWDGVLEVREAVDFLRYYAQQGRARLAGDAVPRGVVACISPWNFPLAIFTGQVAAALVAGNVVAAKPAEQTPLMAARAVSLLHEAGVPATALALLPGAGAVVGAALTADPRTTMVCFTGSVETAAIIDRSQAGSGDPEGVLVAETGGVNAMIVDSTALPEQAVRDVVASAFQSAGQRCSALRLLVLQAEVADAVVEMLAGAMAELAVGDPWLPEVDVGPVVDGEARALIEAHVAAHAGAGRLIARAPLRDTLPAGTYAAPAVIRLERIEDLTEEVFGPVLHVVTFAAHELDDVVRRINATGYGLTLGVHSRVDARMDRVCALAEVGNVYLNRNQIGAVVGVQPFGGEGLSGTGPKAGGPGYLLRFVRATGTPAPRTPPAPRRPGADLVAPVAGAGKALRLVMEDTLERAAAVDPGPILLRGPTGERNTYTLHPRGAILCAGGGDDPGIALARQVVLALASGHRVVIREGTAPAVERSLLTLFGDERMTLAAGRLEEVVDRHAVRLAAHDGGGGARALRRTLAARGGPRIPVLSSRDAPELYYVERAVSEDTTASGGNARLLASL